MARNPEANQHGDPRPGAMVLYAMRNAMLASALVALVACSTYPIAPAPTGPGEYRYAARSAEGASLLVGTLELTFPDDSTVTGTWTIKWVLGADTTTEVGPQVGSGTLAGTRSGLMLSLDLNPGHADHNVFLQGTPTADGFEGDWHWSTFAGPRAAGAFAAIRP